jgi:hypothetical protein
MVSTPSRNSASSRSRAPRIFTVPHTPSVCADDGAAFTEAAAGMAVSTGINLSRNCEGRHLLMTAFGMVLSQVVTLYFPE